MGLITRKIVAGKLAAHLRHELSLDSLAAWAESAMMDGEFDPAHLPTIRDVVARIGVADVRAFGLTWGECEHLLTQLGYSAQRHRGIMPEPKLPVFRLVDGKLIRIPGDVRDPMRRYASTMNIQTGESYLRELTNEEERQQDAEKAAWEAERPQREAEAKRHEKEAEQFRESLKYEPRIVAFLDIMGWAAAIAGSAQSVEATQKLGVAIQGLNAHVKLNAWQREHGGPNGWPGDPMMTQFSDSLLISFAADQNAKSHLEMTLFAVVLNLMFNGFVVRGAVTYGSMIHREALAYGPAMVEAYKLEQESAIDPRIILSPALADTWGAGEPVYNHKSTLLGHRRLWCKDDDSIYFFDHLSNPLFMLDQQEPLAEFRDYMAKWREFIVQRMEENRGNPSVIQKHAWLARYFNRVCTEHPTGHIETISLPGK